MNARNKSIRQNSLAKVNATKIQSPEQKKAVIQELLEMCHRSKTAMAKDEVFGQSLYTFVLQPFRELAEKGERRATRGGQQHGVETPILTPNLAEADLLEFVLPEFKLT